MQIQTDNLFLIGRSHRICQDYTLSGEDKGIHYAIVCDGCSSSKDTDIGARILAITAKRLISFMGLGYNVFGKSVIEYAYTTCQALGLDVTCLDATLMVTAIVNKGFCKTFCYGDGYIIEQFGERTVLVEHTFESGAPFYLSYWLNDQRRAGYEAKFPGHLNVTRWEDGIKTSENSLSFDHEIIINHNIAPGVLILASDGLDSFSGTGNVPLGAESLYVPFAAFKNTNGEYLKRRATKECERLVKEAMLYHQDDLGMASIIFKED